MKKITLLGIVLFTASTLFAQTGPFTWNGSEAIQIWDTKAPNWVDDTSVFPFPTQFIDNSVANFTDVSSYVGNDTIKVLGTLNLAGLNVNATRPYVIRQTSTADVLQGAGTFVKDGTGDFVMDIKNTMTGGTILKNGRLQMEKQTTANIFGAKIVFNGGIANFASSTPSATNGVTVPLEIPTGFTANVEFSRYTNFQSPISGSGNLHIYSGGDRNYIGIKGGVAVNWKNFTGNVLVDRFPTNGVAPGFYGLILNTTKVFKDTLQGLNIDSTFYNRKLTLGTGITVGSESGTATPRAYYFGELNSVDSTSILAGYYKSSNGPKVYYFVGGLNTDVVYPGRIGQAPGFTTHYEFVQFRKIGTGTYTFTNSSNDNVGGGLVVQAGRMLICDKILKGPYLGGCGLSTVLTNGTIGGTGRIGGDLTVSGKLQPGADGIGTLLLSDSISTKYKSKYNLPFGYTIKYSNGTTILNYKNGGTTAINLNLLAGSTSTFEISNTTSYDKVIATGKLRFGADDGTGKPKIKIAVVSGAKIKDGDRFEIIKARSLDVASSDFNIEYPTINGLTWTVESKADTLHIDKETLTITDHLVTKLSTDSAVTTTITLDSTIVSYRVTVIAHGSTAVENPKDNSTISVYPNPTKGDVNISSSEAEIATVEILNLQGQSILRKNVRSTTTNINLNSLAPGVYYTKITTVNGTKVQKLLKQ